MDGSPPTFFQKGQCHEIFASGFFHEALSPRPRVSHKDRFKFFRKFAEIFVSVTPVANLPPVSTTLAAKLPPVSMTPAANLYRYQRHRGQILPRVLLALLIPVANLPPVSTIPAANLPASVNDTCGNNKNNIRLLRP
jgi:hypothetical protein